MDTLTFQSKLQSILDASGRVAADREWCCEWFDVFIRLSPFYEVFHDPEDDDCGSADYHTCKVAINVPDVPGIPPGWFISPEKYLEFLVGQVPVPDGGFEGELARIRGRIINLVSDYIEDYEAVAVLRAAGLPANISRKDSVPLLDRDED